MSIKHEGKSFVLGGVLSVSASSLSKEEMDEFQMQLNDRTPGKLMILPSEEPTLTLQLPLFNAQLDIARKLLEDYVDEDGMKYNLEDIINLLDFHAAIGLKQDLIRIYGIELYQNAFEKLEKEHNEKL